MNDSKLIVETLKSIKKDLIARINQVETKLSAKIDDTNLNIDDLRKETKKGFEDINNRADLIGKQVNTLDEDAPTSDDFNNLVGRVTILENRPFITV